MPTVKQPRGRKISNRLVRKLMIQAAMIAVFAVVSIATATIFIERFLVRAILESEANHFWTQYESDQSVSPPQTANLASYFESVDSLNTIPERFRHFTLGFHKLKSLNSHSMLYVSERHGKRLLVYTATEHIIRPAFFFALMPLLIVLIIILITAWWIYRQSTSLLSPIVWLANKFDRFDPAHPNSSVKDLREIPGDIDWEVEKLVKSLSSYSRRIRRSVERERRFTRGASHEFRTPLTVIKMASDMILAEKDIDKYTRKYASRIRCSVRDIEELIDAFLILARETDKEFEDEPVQVADIVKRELATAAIYLKGKEIAINVEENFDLTLQTAPKVLSIILGNLIRNAAIYTQEGAITVRINEHNVEVSDTGRGMTEDQIEKIFQPYYRAEKDGSDERSGYGIGLTIVQRLSSLFDWTVEVESQFGEGTTFTLSFTESQDA